MASEARNAGQERIPVHIFPTTLEGENYAELIDKYQSNDDLIEFWSNIEEGFLYFETNKVLPKFSVNNKGLYCFE